MKKMYNSHCRRDDRDRDYDRRSGGNDRDYDRRDDRDYDRRYMGFYKA